MNSFFLFLKETQYSQLFFFNLCSQFVDKVSAIFFLNLQCYFCINFLSYLYRFILFDCYAEHFPSILIEVNRIFKNRI